MKKNIIAFLVTLALFVSIAQNSFAQNTDIYKLPISPIPCNKVDPSLSCPEGFIFGGTSGNGIYGDLGDRCATSYADFLSDPITSHYWIEDPVITAQGKTDERARQFLYWVLNTNVIDEAPVLRTIWNFSSIVSLVGVVLIAAIFGIGYIISRRSGSVYNGIGNFFSGSGSGITIWPTIIKIGTMLLYVAFSSAIIFILIQFSEILMRFFFDNLGGKDLFNIYFIDPGNSTLGATEESYKSFVGCRDLNIRVQEGIDTEIFLLKMTNVSYYVMGAMLLLRKILLWFLLFVSPFLALLMPFIFIRNTGWIWIGVFFQWLFYGPLVALFLGAMAKIWGEGIPFSFDFSRAGDLSGYVYPTGINIVYGGPAQRVASGVNRPIGALNNGNYADTFVEYVITLIMLWAVTFFPWWLLRIFRDYCCEGIYAMKNILLAMYDNMRGSPSKGPSPSLPPSLPSLKMDNKTPVDHDIKVNIGSLYQIKQSLTKDLTRTMNLQATRISDIARVETNKQMQQTVNQNLAYISNPVKARVPAERQQFMNLRSELFNRAIKNDTIARTILASTSNIIEEKTKSRESLIQSLPQSISISQVVAQDVHIPKEAFSKITNTYTAQISNNTQAVQRLAQSAGTNIKTVNNILSTYNRYTSQPITHIVSQIAHETNASERIVKHVLRDAGLISAQSSFIQSIASTHKLTKEQVSKVLSSIRSTILRETTVVERVSSQTQIPVENVRSLIKESFTNAASNTTLISTIAEKVKTTPQNVQSIMQEYANNIESATKNIVQNISKKTHIDGSIVVHTLNEASTQIQNQTFLQQTAQKVGVKSDLAKTIIQSAVTATTKTLDESRPAINAITEQAVSGKQLSTTSIQHIINTISKDENTINNIAQNTQTTQQQVQGVLSSYAQNVDKHSSEALNSIAQKTNLSSSQVKNIINTMSTSVYNSPQMKETIVNETKINQKTIENILQSIPSSIHTVSEKLTMIQSIQNSNPVLQTISNEGAQSVINSIARNPTVVSNVANQTNISEENIAKTLNTFASNISNTSSQIIQTLSQQTQLSQEQIHHVLQSTTAFTKNSPQIITQITQDAHAQNEVVQAVVKELPQIIANIKIQAPIITQIQKTASSITTTSQTSISNIIGSIVTNNELIKQVSQETQIQENIVKQSLSTFASNLTQNSSQLLNIISQISHITTEQAQNIVHSATAYASSNEHVLNQTAQSSNTSIANVKNVMENVSRAVSIDRSILYQIQNTSSNLQSISKEHIESIFQEIANNTQFVESVAQKEHITANTIQNIIQSYVNNVDQPSTVAIQNISKESNTSPQTVQNVMSSVANYANKYVSSIQSITQNANLEETTIQELLKTTSDVMVKTAESKNPVIQELVPQKTTLSSEKITTVIQSLSQPTIVSQVAEETTISPEHINTIITELSQHLDQSSESLIQNIADTTKLSVENVTNIIQFVTSQATSNKHIIKSISEQTSVSVPQVMSIIQSTANAVAPKTAEPTQTIKEQIISQTKAYEEKQFTKEIITNVIQAIAQESSIINNVAHTTQINEQQIQQAFQELVKHISESSSQLTQSIAENTNITVEQVQNIMTATSKAIRQSPEIRNTIATNTHTSESTVQQIVNAVPQAITVESSGAMSAIKEVAQTSQTNETTSQQIIQSLMSTAVENNSFIGNLAKDQNLKSQQIKNILTTYARNINQPTEILIQTINQSSGVPKDQVRLIIFSLINTIFSSSEIIAQVSKDEGVSENDVNDVIQKQLEVASEPEKHIEKTITIPETISLEDYEEVKEMWTKHYEEGEVPVTETIKTRKDWIEQEVIYITNTLNKILSPDEKLQQEGLDELGYLLPIFLINNLTGEELIVYLKAKLEAAKLVMKILEKEETIKNELKEEDEEFVEIPLEEKAEEPKHMAMNLDENEAAPQNIEEQVKDVQEKLSSRESSDNSEENDLSIDDIKTRLNNASIPDEKT